MGMKSLEEMKRGPAYISTAADPQHALGTDDPQNIKVVDV
jgi:hypothetical protein